jgi:hypothetical protein
MSNDPDDYLNDPIDDELDAAVKAAEELVIRAKTVGLEKLELRIPDQSALWTVTVKKSGIEEQMVPGAEGHSANGGKHDGKMS